jgi:predicted amidohydrolase
MKVAAVSFPLIQLQNFDNWVSQIKNQVREAAESGAVLVLFPEYVTASLLSLKNEWQVWDQLWQNTICSLAREYDLLVVGGTHLITTKEGLRNRCLLAWPDGSVDFQDKLQPTPWEYRWNLPRTHQVKIFRHEGVMLAVPICYDVEFPEGVRAAVAAGAEILLVPSWTDDEHGFWRVRHCAQARCVENVVYAVHAPLVGGIKHLPEFEEASGTAGILTPCDAGFPRQGIAAEGAWNKADIIVAELDIKLLRQLRSAGTVTPWVDRRPESDYKK